MNTGILTPKEMRNVIMNGGSIAWQGRLITRENIHELPSQADYSVLTGEGIDSTKLSLEQQMEDLKMQMAKLSEAKSIPKVKAEKSKTSDETLESSLISSKPVK